MTNLPRAPNHHPKFTTTLAACILSAAGCGDSSAGNIAPAATDVAMPLDATPDPDGETIYFTAADPNTGAGVYRVAFSGGKSKALSVGEPFAAPFGIAISTDGETLFVADAAATSGDEDGDDLGQVFTVKTETGSRSVLRGTEGLAPRSLEVWNDDDVDHVFFTGRNAAGAGVFRVSASGGAVVPVHVGDPFVDPSGVVIAENGDVYVIDIAASSAGTSTLYRVSNKVVTELVTGLAVGYPAGIALTMDESTLYISGFDPKTLRDVVIVVELASRSTSFYTGDADTDLTQFGESAGLHRAKNANKFAWADSQARVDESKSTAGTVFGISF